MPSLAGYSGMVATVAERHALIRRGREGTRVVRSGFLGDVVGYMLHCAALAWPGVQVPLLVEPAETPDLPKNLSPDELDRIADEARRQSERQTSDFQDLRSRSLSMATVALTELGLLAGTSGRFLALGGMPLAFWLACFLITALGLAGMASVASTEARFMSISIPRLLKTKGEPRWVYANELSACLPLGRATIDTRTTLFRHALALMVLGGVAYGVLWAATLRS